MVGTVGSRYAREDRKEGDIRVQKVLVPVNKLSFCSSFMSSSVPHEIAAREEAVPVPFRHYALSDRFCCDGGPVAMKCLAVGL